MLELADIQAAAATLAGVVHRTPVLRSRGIDAMTGVSLHFKAENLQRAGAFKIRGAYNKIARLPAALRQRGVISYSSGNHAQGVALAASLFGVPATIVVPEDIVPAKRDATVAYGARVVHCGRSSAERYARAQELAAAEALCIVPPYDDADIIAGQGTVALELLSDVPDLDVLVVPVGGGGLMAGCAIAARALRRAIRVIGVEPVDGDDTRRSLQSGVRETISTPRTIADGLRVVQPGEITFPIIQRLVDDIVTVTDDDIRRAMRLLLERAKVLVEPSGAVGLAAILAHRIPTPGRIGIVLSGGNVAMEDLPGLLAHAG